VPSLGVRMGVQVTDQVLIVRERVLNNVLPGYREDAVTRSFRNRRGVGEVLTIPDAIGSLGTGQ